jgi:hypothetical protein
VAAGIEWYEITPNGGAHSRAHATVSNIAATLIPAVSNATFSYYFFSLAGGEVLTRVPDSPQFWHFFGLQRQSTVAPHFSHVKTAIGKSPLFLNVVRFKSVISN